MKKILSILAVCAIAASAFATGNEGVNPPQSGVVQTTNLVPGISNYAFPFPYQTVPVMTVFASATNATPVTNSITTTNFTLTFPVNGSTNNSFAWTAYVGATRVESGSAISGGGTNLTVSFPYPYAPGTIPVVVADNASTNINSFAAIQNITSTNFQILTGLTVTNQWISIGTVLSPASPNTGTFPGLNTIIY